VATDSALHLLHISFIAFIAKGFVPTSLSSAYTLLSNPTLHGEFLLYSAESHFSSTLTFLLKRRQISGRKSYVFKSLLSS
jgi:hypothetical protein